MYCVFFYIQPYDRPLNAFHSAMAVLLICGRERHREACWQHIFSPLSKRLQVISFAAYKNERFLASHSHISKEKRTMPSDF